MIHLNAIPGNQTVAYGMDLSEYYLNVEWDILRVPAVRHVKKYPCCPEPYPGEGVFNLVGNDIKGFLFLGYLLFLY